MADDIRDLGPLAPFAGTREGTKGVDLSPDDDGVTVERNEFSERAKGRGLGFVNPRSRRGASGRAPDTPCL